MKATLIAGLICLGVGVSGYSNASGCGGCDQATYVDPCSQGACYSAASCQPVCGYGTCSCTDPTCRNNSCISAGACCTVFGNVGALNDAGGAWPNR